MIYLWLNLLPIVLAAAAGLAVGWAYRKLLRAPSRGGAAYLATRFVAETWLAAILAGALILAPSAKAGAWTMALGSAVVIWIGFVLPATVVTLTGRGVRRKPILIECGFWLTVMLVQAAALHLIGVVPPPHA